MASNTPEMDDSMEDIPEDAYITDSLSSLSDVHVPSAFLPNVMFRVYEKHYRGQVSWKFVSLVSFLMLVLCCGFFAWDIELYRDVNGLTTFMDAFAQKTNILIDDIDAVFSSLTGLLKATWQIVTGAFGVYFDNVPVIMQIVIALGLITLLYFLIKWLSGLVSK